MRVRSLARLVVAAVVLLLVAVGCVPSKPPPLRVEYWGDSIGAQAGPYFNFCPVKEVVVDGWNTCPVSMPGAMRYATAMTARVLQDFHLS